MNKLGQPEDITNMVAFIASPDAGWINAQNIIVNGGMIVGYMAEHGICTA